MSAGSFLIGIAVGLLLGGLATYGAIFAWAVRQGADAIRDEEDRNAL
jgi:hypothetical protein